MDYDIYIMDKAQVIAREGAHGRVVTKIGKISMTYIHLHKCMISQPELKQ